MLRRWEDARQPLLDWRSGRIAIRYCLDDVRIVQCGKHPNAAACDGVLCAAQGASPGKALAVQHAGAHRLEEDESLVQALGVVILCGAHRGQRSRRSSSRHACWGQVWMP